jgi:UDP-N-acetylglucosamine enolpyruvyl transferase
MPARLEIEGGVPLRGSVRASAAKNAALPALAAALLSAGPVRLTKHVAELARMGARVDTDGAIAVIRGVPSYQGAPIMASDLRASAALVLAGLVARGRTTVSRVYHLDRGYERLEQKLVAMGACIERRT